MSDKPKISKALVVLSPELVKPEMPMQSALLKRAVALAKRTGCELELFHVCYDGSLENQLFTSETELMRQRAIRTDRAALEVAEIAARLQAECPNVSHEVRWDSPRTDAILKKIATAQPDIVMKHGREHSYILGISSNTDWDLARRSPAHVWFVNDDVEDIDRIVAAVGNKLGDPGDITTLTDQRLLRTAGVIGETLDAEVYPVNAYVVPPAAVNATHLGGTVAAVRSVDEHREYRRKIVERHEDAVNALAEFVGIPQKNVRIQEGHPNEVIPETAEKIGADMVVLAAKNISRLERLVKNVTVEPVIAGTEADILVVREPDLSAVPMAPGKPFYGIPQYDIERAVTHPDDAFESPRELANLSEISIDLRRRILQAWELDVRAEMEAENEGVTASGVNADLLKQIADARDTLAAKKRSRSDAGTDELSLTA